MNILITYRLHRFLPYYVVIAGLLLASLVDTQKISVGDVVVGRVEEITCDTPQGKLLGAVLKSRGGRNFYSFRAIPYAERPERFQPAELGKKWEGVRFAQEYSTECAQFFGSSQFSGSEDCLYLNVHSPNINPDANLNVMVWIHGGGFQWGAGGDYNPEYFMDEDVILVTFNYRLGVLGFLSTRDNVVPGNNGLKDQVVALQWVKKHISSFGGSPDKVTIFGESAGGAAANYHLLSKLSRGLFQNAIGMSGSSLNPMLNQLNATRNTQALGKQLNCEGTSSQIVNCLKGKNLENIMEAQMSFVEWDFYPACQFSVVVEPKANSEAFLSDTPYNLMKSVSFPKVPYMTGITADEGLFMTAGILHNDVLKKELNEDFKRVAPIVLQYKEVKSKDWISEKLLQFYSQGKPFEKSNWKDYNNLFGDRVIVSGVVNAANMLAKNTKVYPYIFSYQGKASVLNTFHGIPGVHGVSHMDELMYLFKEVMGTPLIDKNTEAEKVSVNFVKSFVEFAKTGIPKPWGKEKNWKPISPQEKKNMWYDIGAETKLEDINLTMGSRLKLWASLFPEDEVAASQLTTTRPRRDEL